MPDVVWYFVWARVVGVCAVARVRAVQRPCVCGERVAVGYRGMNDVCRRRHGGGARFAAAG